MTRAPVTAGCPGCGAPPAETHSTGTYTSPVTGQHYRLSHCHACDLEFWSPRHLNPELYESAALHEYAQYHQGTRPFPAWTLPFFDHMPQNSGRLLDVGCGDGAFLARAASLGFQVHGIDLDPNSVRVAREKYGLQHVEAVLLDSFLQSSRASGTRYDVVCLFEVLEHQAEPRAFLDAIQALLVPGGYVAGSVPNRQRFLTRLDRRAGTGDLPPHHFLWFSSRALANILTQHGFRDVRVVPSGNIGFRALLAKVAQLILSKLGARATGRLLLGAALRIAIAPIVAVLWLGRIWRPAHLYFQARHPGKAA
jgi:SAM-dependent methyltransferase